MHLDVETERFRSEGRMTWTLKHVSPFSGIDMTVPIRVECKLEEELASYWLPGGQEVLQLSSRRITQLLLKPASASERIHDMLSREAGVEVEDNIVPIPACPDVASSTIVDEEGYLITFCYAVWPDRALLATITGPSETSRVNRMWSVQSIGSVRRIA